MSPLIYVILTVVVVGIVVSARKSATPTSAPVAIRQTAIRWSRKLM